MAWLGWLAAAIALPLLEEQPRQQLHYKVADNSSQHTFTANLKAHGIITQNVNLLGKPLNWWEKLSSLNQSTDQPNPTNPNNPNWDLPGLSAQIVHPTNPERQVVIPEWRDEQTTKEPPPSLKSEERWFPRDVWVKSEVVGGTWEPIGRLEICQFFGKSPDYADRGIARTVREDESTYAVYQVTRLSEKEVSTKGLTLPKMTQEEAMEYTLNEVSDSVNCTKSEPNNGYSNKKNSVCHINADQSVMTVLRPDPGAPPSVFRIFDFNWVGQPGSCSNIYYRNCPDPYIGPQEWPPFNLKDFGGDDGLPFNDDKRGYNNLQSPVQVNKDKQ